MMRLATRLYLALLTFNSTQLLRGKPRRNVYELLLLIITNRLSLIVPINYIAIVENKYSLCARAKQEGW